MRLSPKPAVDGQAQLVAALDDGPQRALTAVEHLPDVLGVGPARGVRIPPAAALADRLELA
jgi:hypothetical protein